MSSCVNGQYRTLPSIKIGGFDVRFLSLESDRLAILPESLNTTNGRLLFLGSDLLPVLGTFVLRSNQVRVHQRFSKIGLATRRHMKGFKVSGVPNSKVIYFYSIQGVFKVVFEFGSKHMQRDCLEKLAQPWLSSFNEPLLQPDGDIAWKSEPIPSHCSTTVTVAGQTEMGPNTHPLRDSTQPLRDSTQPLRHSTQPLRDSTQPLRDSTQPLRDSTQPLRDSTQPLRDSTQPLRDSTQPLRHSTQPLRHSTQPLRHSTQPLRHSTQPLRDSIANRPLHSENRDSNHVNYLASFEVKGRKPNQKRVFDIGKVDIGKGCSDHDSSETGFNGKILESFNTIEHGVYENIGHISVHQSRRIAQLLRTCVQYIQYIVQQPLADSMLVLFHIMEEFIEHHSDGSDVMNYNGSYGMDENHFALMCIICTKVGEQLNKVRPFIKQKVDTFKQENLLRLDKLPSSIEIIDQLFPSFMVSLVVSWVRESPTAWGGDHTYTGSEGGADLDIEREAKQVQLILELCTGSLISSLAHLVQYQCSKGK